jgi:hypothetical protein
MKRWQKVLICVAIPIAILSMVYFAMYSDTNQITEDIETLLKGNVEGKVSVYPEITRYDYSVPGEIITLSQAKVDRPLLIHDFSDGYMFVVYSGKVETEKGSGEGSHNCKAIWRIHKEDGAWRIMDVYEPVGQADDPLLFLYEYFTGKSHMDWNF